MPRKDRSPIDPTKPALIITYGSCPGKVRPLDRDLLVIGRAPACDLVLNSPEVSPVHCLLVKTADGWLLRNTNPRVGTHLNGQLVQDILLNDDDSLQIGTFSFKVHLPRPADADALPDSPVAAPVAEPRARRWQAARQRAVRLAWNLRRRLLQKQGQLRAERQAFAERMAELDERGQAVDARQRECTNLLLLLEEQEEEVNGQRQAVLEAAAELQASRRQAEQDIAHLRAEAAAAPHPAEKELQTRKDELDAYARHLRQLYEDGTAADALRVENEELRRQLAEREASPTLQAELDALRQRLVGLETVSGENDELLAQVVRLEAELKQRAERDAQADQLQVELETLRSYSKDRDAELDRLWQAEAGWTERAGELVALEPLRQDNERLSEQAAALTADLAKLGETYEAAVKVAGEELQQLRDKLQTARADLKRQADQLADAAALRSENEQLQQQVRELGNVLDEKTRLQKRLDEQRQELAALRERLQAKDDELRHLRVADTTPPNASEQAELVIAVETLLRENEDFRKRLLNQARALQELGELEPKVRALQAEADELRAQLRLREATVDFGSHSESVELDPTAPVEPNKYLLAENAELKAQLELQAAALRDGERQREQAAALQTEVDAFHAKREEKASPRFPDADAGWRDLIAPVPGSETLLHENDALRNRLAEQQADLAEAAQLRTEVESLRTELQHRAAWAADGKEAGPALADDERAKLTARIAELESQIRERDERLAVLEAENAQLKQDLDHEVRTAYEIQLRDEREALLTERARLEQELRHVREDRQELDAAAQAAELHASKERVQITREWAELNRKREEFRMEMETLKRDSVRDNLERVRRIKEESKRIEPLAALVAQRIGERRKVEPARAPE